MLANEELGWLIRDNKNVIRGPFTHEEVLQLIRKGQLKGKTEISRANSYWFAIDEKAEIARFFPEMGIEAPEAAAATQQTITKIDQAQQGEESKVEVTKFTPSILEEKDKQTGTEVQWLNDEMAEEFGDDFDMMVPDSSATDSGGNISLPSMSTEKTEIDKLSSRANVKKDTLPSEFKGAIGERPTPIDALLKGGHEKPASSSGHAPSPNMVNMTVHSPDMHGKIIAEGEAEPKARKSGLAIAVGAMVALAVLGGGAYFLLQRQSAQEVATTPVQTKPTLPPLEAIKYSFVLFDLAQAKAALAEMEMEKKGDPILPLAQALLKREFLYDLEGALASLQMAKSLVQDATLSREIDNLIGVYDYDRNPVPAIGVLKKVSEENPQETLYRFNYGTSLFRSGRYDESIAVLQPLLAKVKDNKQLSLEVTLLLGWAQEAGAVRGETSQDALFSKAVDVDAFSAKARLSHAIQRFKKIGIKESEQDFKAFLELMPDLEPNAEVINFRKMNTFDIFNVARNQIRELNVPGGAAGAKPSPLVMAVDAVLSTLQSRSGEASKILEGAFSVAPGDSNIMKAMAYHRWREGRYDEVIDLFKDTAKERNSYLVNFLLGKSYEKLGKVPQAEKHFLALTTISPSRSEGFSALGHLYASQKKDAEAKKYFELALSKKSVDLLALQGLDDIQGAGNIQLDLFKSLLPF